jgi:hypothetical protein
MSVDMPMAPLAAAKINSEWTGFQPFGRVVTACDSGALSGEAYCPGSLPPRRLDEEAVSTQ